MAISGVKSTATVTTSSTAPASYGPALAVLTTLFFIWGSLTSLNDVLIPFAQNVFNLAIDASMLIQTAFFSAYLILLGSADGPRCGNHSAASGCQPVRRCAGQTPNGFQPSKSDSGIQFP